MPRALFIRAINYSAALFALASVGCSGGSSTGPTPPPTSVSIGISLSAPTLSIATGSTGTMTATVTRAGGYSGAVTVNVTGLPAGVTVSSNTQTTTGTTTSATLTLTVVSAASAGTSTVTVSASGAGVTTVSATFTLTITSVASTNLVTLTWAQCLAGARPLFVASQDGATGAWTRVPGTNGVYTFNITQAKGGYAYVLPSLGGSAHQTTVFLGTRAEVGAGGAPVDFCSNVAPPNRSVTGTITGVGPGQAVNIAMGGRPGIASFQSQDFTITNIPNGPHDLVAFRSSTLPSAQDRGLIRRDQTLANNTNVGVLDMNGTESFGLTTANLTIGGAPAGGISAASIVFLSGASCDPAAVTGVSGLQTMYLIAGVPDARMRATDMHQVTVLASGSAEGNRSTTEIFHTMADRTIDLPTSFPVTVALAPGPYKRASAAFTLPPEYNLIVSLNVASTSIVRNSVSVTATVGWTGLAVTLVTPDFTGLTGWDVSWGPSSTATSNWTLSASGSTQAAGASLCVAGTKLWTASRTGQL